MSDTTGKLFERQIVFWGNMGVIWVLTWLLNPNIDSGLVWLLAFIFSSLSTDIYRNYQEMRRR